MYFSSLIPTLLNKEIYVWVHLATPAEDIWFLSREFSLSEEKA